MSVPDATPARSSGPERILRLAQGYLSTSLLSAAVELGIFDVIAAGEHTTAAIASATNADARGVRVLLDALTALGLLTLSDAGYELSPLAANHLVSGRSAYMGGVVRAYVDRDTWAALGDLAAMVRQGGRAPALEPRARSRRRWARMAGDLATVSNPASAPLIAALEPWLGDRSILEVLDVGCGNGALGHAIASHHPGATVTCVDWHEVLSAARDNAKRSGILDRTRYIAGDMFEVAFGGLYDLAILSQVLHGLAEGDSIELLRRVASAIRPGGRVALHDYMAQSTSPRDEPGPYLFSAILLARTPAGEARTVDGHRRMLATAGLHTLQTISVPELPTRIMIAERTRDEPGVTSRTPISTYD